MLFWLIIDEPLNVHSVLKCQLCQTESNRTFLCKIKDFILQLYQSLERPRLVMYWSSENLPRRRYKRFGKGAKKSSDWLQDYQKWVMKKILKLNATTLNTRRLTCYLIEVLKKIWKVTKILTNIFWHVTVQSLKLNKKSDCMLLNSLSVAGSKWVEYFG